MASQLATLQFCCTSLLSAPPRRGRKSHAEAPLRSEGDPSSPRWLPPSPCRPSHQLRTPAASRAGCPLAAPCAHAALRAGRAVHAHSAGRELATPAAYVVSATVAARRAAYRPSPCSPPRRPRTLVACRTNAGKPYGSVARRRSDPGTREARPAEDGAAVYDVNAARRRGGLCSVLAYKILILYVGLLVGRWIYVERWIEVRKLRCDFLEESH
jgi:hypothetical protein